MLCDGFTYLSQSIGVTATLPHSVPSYLPLTGAGSDEWIYCGNRLYHNQSSVEFQNFPSLRTLTIHQTVGLQISTNGKLHLFIDKQHVNCVATGLPVNTPLWGAVNVRYSCTKIKSEMLSGELDTYRNVHVYILILISALECTYTYRKPL